MAESQHENFDNVDVVIVGAGIGGGALATVLSGAGLNVVMLEKTLEHKDVVRGEWLAPWGVREADELGLTDVYMNAGANRVARHVNYSDLESREASENAMIMLNEAAGTEPLCIGHPKACNLLNAEAVARGTTLIRGVSRLRVSTGRPPSVRFSQGAQEFKITPRWVVGADGRNGIVADQIGCTLQQDPEHHLFSGMLVDRAEGWPEDLQVIATEGDVNILAFPQGEGRVRIYLGWPSAERNLLVGPDGPKRFLERWQVDCVPNADTIASANPISPCIAYPNFDSWIDSPVKEGVVLIGDAAGRNDPIIGQGLSITHRDVRQVRDAFLNENDWRPEMFDGYVEERKERMSRLRVSARLTSLKDSAFGKDGQRLRAEIHERVSANPELMAPILAPFVGPEQMPAEVFAEDFTTALVGQPIWDALP